MDSPATYPTRVRELIDNLLVRYGAPRDAATHETLLIHDGNYCGHRMQKADYAAVWFIEEDQVKVFGPTGALLEALKPSVLCRNAKQAA